MTCCDCDPDTDFGAQTPDTNPVAYSNRHVDNHVNTEVRMRAFAPDAGWAYMYLLPSTPPDRDLDIKVSFRYHNTLRKSHGPRRKPGISQ